MAWWAVVIRFFWGVCLGGLFISSGPVWCLVNLSLLCCPMSLSKEQCRLAFAECAPPQTTAGKIAERLRRISVYREAKTILMMPSPLLFQARINCLLDGKNLIMPSPALKTGFYRVKPFAIAFPDLAYGTSLKGISMFGKKMPEKQLKNAEIDLALTGCVALDRQGRRLGEGTGFFDLSMGVFAEYGGVTDETPVGCVLGPDQLSEAELSSDAWDVGVDFMVMADRDMPISRPDGLLPRLDWQVLSKKQIRKMDPLWRLYCMLFPVANEQKQEVVEPSAPPSPWDRQSLPKS